MHSANDDPDHEMMALRRLDDDDDVPWRNGTPPPPSQPQASYLPPNGGAKAWLQVLGSWMLIFNTWGKAGPFSVPGDFGL